MHARKELCGSITGGGTRQMSNRLTDATNTTRKGWVGGTCLGGQRRDPGGISPPPRLGVCREKAGSWGRLGQSVPLRNSRRYIFSIGENDQEIVHRLNRWRDCTEEHGAACVRAASSTDRIAPSIDMSEHGTENSECASCRVRESGLLSNATRGEWSDLFPHEHDQNYRSHTRGIWLRPIPGLIAMLLVDLQFCAICKPGLLVLFQRIR
jgi:hypothetical protein